ncbi:DUF5672 family protein [Roseateles terrae]|uniref:DUF5672 domain-containing protein n=1 Tax=Roseateles terrae TaxID=431060 RepID=A0ABR6GML7_9BURK|nr:DUF5672 family protein [Roseateles terrae]MBB3192912.1 hypothetical protein [Roseateles terrae]OWQ89832.1 hypothetical protein CDN98_04835 [Roseateles terrae]
MTVSPSSAPDTAANDATVLPRPASGPRLAVAIIDTDLHQLARQALLHSMQAMERQGLPFSQVLIYSDKPELWGGLPVIRIPTLRSINEYNLLVTQELARHLTADFVLVIQYDGFVLNADQFSPHFLHYDYIGAPWPNYDRHDVGNGGFSWRSRRLVQAVAQLDYDDPSEAEDLFICRRMRETLERMGCRFAPKAIAQHFSVEFPAVPFPTFGFHGIFHLPSVYRESPDFLVEHLSDRIIKSRSNYLLPGLQVISPAAAQRLQQRLDALNALNGAAS